MKISLNKLKFHKISCVYSAVIDSSDILDVSPHYLSDSCGCEDDDSLGSNTINTSHAHVQCVQCTASI